MSPILGIWASQNYSRYSLPTSFESIATVTVGAGGSGSVTFSSIPSTYTHLQIRTFARNIGTNSNNLITFNSDSNANYNWHDISGDGSTVSLGGSVGQTFTLAGRMGTSNESANIFGAGVIDILDYANTNKLKTLRVLTGVDANGSGAILYNSGLWRSTNAITSITINSADTYVQYSHFALYGIRGN